MRFLLCVLLLSLLAVASPARGNTSSRSLLDSPPSSAAGAVASRRVIWILWFDGWDSETTPWLVQNVARSWELHNPTWHVQRLSRANLGDFLQVPYLERMHELTERTGRGWRKPVRKWLPPAQARARSGSALSSPGRSASSLSSV
jgi:hypothetical protein